MSHVICRYEFYLFILLNSHLQIDHDNTAKITDVGVAKPTNVLVRTCNGSPAYMAPEVLLSSQTQSNKIDIYSLSFIYWEMWFGTEVTVDMNRCVPMHCCVLFVIDAF